MGSQSDMTSNTAGTQNNMALTGKIKRGEGDDYRANTKSSNLLELGYNHG
jgi:hypothetical protein